MIAKAALNKSPKRFDTFGRKLETSFSVRPECRAERGVSKGLTENTQGERWT